MPEGLSDNESDYKSHILYVVPNEKNSKKALQQLQSHPGVETEVWVQDVRLLQPPLPAWLKGVPTIISRKEAIPHAGTACLQYLSHLQQSTPDSMAALPPGTAGCQSFGDGKPMGRIYEPAEISDTKNWLGKDEKIDAKMMDQYIAAREAQDRNFGESGQSKEIISTQS